MDILSSSTAAMAWHRKILSPAFAEERRLQVFAMAAIIFLGTIAVFWPARHFGFLYFDDDINIFLNPNLGGFDRITASWMFTDYHYMRRYIPAGWAGLSALYGIFGLNAHGYHSACILLHGINAVLVMAICHEIINRFSPRQSGWMVFPSALASAWWAWQPMRVETVAWASGYLYTQAIFFLLVSFYLYISRAEIKSNSFKLYLSAVGYLISIASYPLALAYPAVLIIWEVTVLRREKPLLARELWLKLRRPLAKILLWFGLPSVVFGAATLYASYNADPFWRSVVSRDTSLNLAEKLGRAIYVWGYYLWKPWWPFHHLLVPDRLGLAAWSEKNFLICTAAFISMSWFLLARRNSYRSGIWAIGASYLILLIPMLGLFDVSYFTSDRYGYLNSLPIAIALAVGLSVNINFRWKCIIGVIFAFNICSQMVIVRAQLPCWKNSSAFFCTLLNSLPRSAKLKLHVYYMLAYALEIEGHYDLAKAICTQGMAEYPNAEELITQRYAIDKSASEAAGITQTLGMKSLLSEVPRSHFWIALQKIQHAEWQEAADHLNAALNKVPDFYPARLKLAEVLTMQGKPDEALSCYLKALATSNGRLSTDERAAFFFMLASAGAANGEERLARIAFAKGEELRADSHLRR